MIRKLTHLQSYQPVLFSSQYLLPLRISLKTKSDLSHGCRIKRPLGQTPQAKTHSDNLPWLVTVISLCFVFLVNKRSLYIFDHKDTCTDKFLVSYIRGSQCKNQTNVAILYIFYGAMNLSLRRSRRSTKSTCDMWQQRTPRAAALYAFLLICKCTAV